MNHIMKLLKMGILDIPLLDACIRYLKTNGWINFRMRAMLVSFASYQLWLDWKKTSNFLHKFLRTMDRNPLFTNSNAKWYHWYKYNKNLQPN